MIDVVPCGGELAAVCSINSYIITGSAAPEPQAGHPSGKLVIWGDLVDMSRPGTPLRCFNTNRFRRGQRAGFRMTAIDGGTGEVENTAELVVHLDYGGRVIDIPMRWRGVGNFNTSNLTQFTVIE